MRHRSTPSLSTLRHFLACLVGLVWLLASVQPLLVSGELHDALSDQDLVRLERALKAHPEFVDDRDVEGRTALHLAAQSGQLPAVELLVRAGAGVNVADRSGSTPLMLATAGNHTAVADYLRRHGAGAVDFSKVNDSVLSGTTWCIFAGVALFGLVLFIKILTRKKKSPDELLADEMNDQG